MGAYFVLLFSCSRFVHSLSIAKYPKEEREAAAKSALLQLDAVARVENGGQSSDIRPCSRNINLHSTLSSTFSSTLSSSHAKFASSSRKIESGRGGHVEKKSKVTHETFSDVRRSSSFIGDNSTVIQSPVQAFSPSTTMSVMSMTSPYTRTMPTNEGKMKLKQPSPPLVPLNPHGSFDSGTNNYRHQIAEGMALSCLLSVRGVCCCFLLP